MIWSVSASHSPRMPPFGVEVAKVLKLPSVRPNGVSASESTYAQNSPRCASYLASTPFATPTSAKRPPQSGQRKPRFVIFRAPAKINLTLEILNRQDDGYHRLRS